MKRLFSLAAVWLGVCLSQNALAADLSVPALAPARPPPLSWNGFYVGANASVPWTDRVTFTADDPAHTFGTGFLTPVLPISMSASDSGWGLGPIVGYNWQVSNFLLGVEGDIDWGKLSLGATQQVFCCVGAPPFPLPGFTATSHIEVNSLATVRGRAGFIWNNRASKPPGFFAMPGDFLFYGTGGVAWAQTEYSADLNCPAGVPTCGVAGVPTSQHAPVSISQTKTGSVWGGGVEWAPAVTKGKLIWGIEYLNFHFDKGNNLTGTTVNGVTGVPAVSIFSTCPAGTPCVPYSASGLTINDIRFRVTYKWN